MGGLIVFFVVFLVPLRLLFLAAKDGSEDDPKLRGCLVFLGYILVIFIFTRFYTITEEKNSLVFTPKFYASPPPSVSPSPINSLSPTPIISQEIDFDVSDDYNLNDPKIRDKFCSHFNPFPMQPKNLKFIDDYVDKCGIYGYESTLINTSRFCCFIYELKQGVNNQYKLEDLSPLVIKASERKCVLNYCYKLEKDNIESSEEPKKEVYEKSEREKGFDGLRERLRRGDGAW